MPDPVTPNSRLIKLSEAFRALTHREMKDLAEVISETLTATNGVIVKPEVFADVFDTFGDYLAIETEE